MTFWTRVDASGDCWLWTGARSKNGYGRLQINKQDWYAHRYAYQELVGPILLPELDHLCMVKHCVNPDHLEPVTRRENVRRNKNRKGGPPRRAFCRRGHPLTGQNLYEWQGNRACRRCRNDYKRERRRNT